MKKAVLFIILLLCLAGTVLAQSAPPRLSNDAEAAFAFYKLTGQHLDIDQLILSSPFYKSLAPVDQFDFLRMQRGVLTDTYARFSPLTTPLVLRLTTQIVVEDTPALMRLVMDSADPPHFSFEALGQKIAVIPDNFSDYTLLPLADAVEAYRMRMLLGVAGRGRVYLDLIPYQARAGATVRLDNQPQRPILARIARFRVIAFSGKTLFDYIDPRYAHLYRGAAARLGL